MGAFFPVKLRHSASQPCEDGPRPGKGVGAAGSPLLGRETRPGRSRESCKHHSLLVGQISSLFEQLQFSEL